jgi:hypothetical protein
MGSAFYVHGDKGGVRGITIYLSAKDFLMVFRRFVSVYRNLAHMFLDNRKKNLTLAERLLRVELERLKGDSVLEKE